MCPPGVVGNLSYTSKANRRSRYATKKLQNSRLLQSNRGTQKAMQRNMDMPFGVASHAKQYAANCNAKRGTSAIQYPATKFGSMALMQVVVLCISIARHAMLGQVMLCNTTLCSGRHSYGVQRKQVPAFAQGKRPPLH